jgi:hypothetical protein
LVVNPASLWRTIWADTLPACTNLCTLFMFFFLAVSFIRCRSVDLVWLGLVFFCVDGKGFCFGAYLCEGFISQRGTSYDGGMYQEFYIKCTGIFLVEVEFM